jgi:hypothetical protein
MHSSELSVLPSSDHESQPDQPVSVAAATAVGALALPGVVISVQLAEPIPAFMSSVSAGLATLSGSAFAGALVLGGGRFIAQRISQWRQ